MENSNNIDKSLDLGYLDSTDALNENTTLTNTQMAIDSLNKDKDGIEINIKEDFNKLYKKISNWTEKEKEEIKRRLIWYIADKSPFFTEQAVSSANENGSIKASKFRKDQKDRIRIDWEGYAPVIGPISQKPPHEHWHTTISLRCDNGQWYYSCGSSELISNPRQWF